MRHCIPSVLALAGFAILSGADPRPARAQIPPPQLAAVPGLSSEITFELYRGSRIVLEGKINGTRTEMILDSGAEVTTLSREFARSIGLEKGVPVVAEGSGGGDTAELFENISLEVGNLKLTGVTIAVIDLGPIEKAVGRPIPAILGRELFTNSIVRLDFDRKLLAFTRPGDFAAPAGSTEVKLTQDNALFFFPVSIDGLAPIDALLDIGNDGALSLSKEYQESIPELQALPSATLLAGGVGGLHPARRVTLPKVEFAGFTFHKVPSALSTVEGGPYAGRVNVGIELLKPFDVALDLGHGRMWLKRTQRPAEFHKDRAGLFVTLEGDHFNVLHVAPGSPAAKAGLKRGEQILAIDGEPARSGFYSSTASDWASRPAGTQIAVTTAPGKTMILTLADYY